MEATKYEASRSSPLSSEVKHFHIVLWVWHSVILFVNTEAEREAALTASIFTDNHAEGSTM